MTAMRLLFALGLATLTATGAGAATTNWMDVAKARKYGPFLKKQVYPTSIECRRGSSPRKTLVRFRTSTADPANKPFHKWQFVVSETADLNRTIGKIRLKDHPELKWRIVASNSYRTTNGADITCAVIYRGTGPA